MRSIYLASLVFDERRATETRRFEMKGPDYPNDADGDALRRVAETADMSKPMDIDFAVDVPSQVAGEEVARLASERGYKTSVDFGDSSKRWTCYCTKRMLATYEGVIAAQKKLDELSAPVGGQSDGWGTFGNLQ